MNPKGNMLKEPSSSAAKSRHQAKMQNGKCTTSETGEKDARTKKAALVASCCSSLVFSMRHTAKNLIRYPIWSLGGRKKVILGHRRLEISTERSACSAPSKAADNGQLPQVESRRQTRGASLMFNQAARAHHNSPSRRSLPVRLTVAVRWKKRARRPSGVCHARF